MRSRTALATIAILVMTAATACGASGGGGTDVSAAEQPYVDALAASMLEDTDEDAIDVTEEQAECIGARFVDVIGVDRLEEQDITPENLGDTDLEFTELGLDADDGEALYDSFGDCDVDLRQAFLDAMAADDEVTDAMKTCFEGVFTEDFVRKLMITTMVDGEDAVEDDPALAAEMGGLMGCAFMGMGEVDSGG